MTAISQSSLRALGCIRLRARTRPTPRATSAPSSLSNRLYAQLAPKTNHDQDREDQYSECLEQEGHYPASDGERYGREFVRRHLQELDRVRRSDYHDLTREELRTEISGPAGTLGCHPSGENVDQTRQSPSPAICHKPIEISNNSTRSAMYSSPPRTEERIIATPISQPRIPVDNLAQEISSILTSPSAIDNPSAALLRALAHHRERISVSSVYSFNALLSYAARISNYHLMRKILRDMQKGNVQWDEDTRRIVMKATLRVPREGERKHEPESFGARHLGPPKGGVDSLNALRRRLEASTSSVPDGHRQIALSAGYWVSATPSASGEPASRSHPMLPFSCTPTHANKCPPSSRISTLQGALSPAAARSHLPPSDGQLSPALFLAFLRYILACNPQPPLLADSYAALLALERPEREVTTDHLVHLTHLYLHPSLYSSFRPFWVIREMQRLSKDGSVAFTPTSETLEKALLSLRARKNRDRRAVELVEYFRRKWGEEIVTIACWRLVGRYGLERKHPEVQEFATVGGNEALARQIQEDAQKRLRVTELPGKDMETIPASRTVSQDISDPFPRLGLDRRKWGRVRQAIVRSQRRLRRESDNARGTLPQSDEE